MTVRRLVLNSDDIEMASRQSVSGLGRLGETKKLAILFQIFAISHHSPKNYTLRYRFYFESLFQ